MNGVQISRVPKSYIQWRIKESSEDIILQNEKKEEKKKKNEK